MTRTKFVLAAFFALAFAMPTLANAEVVVKAGGGHGHLGARAEVNRGWHRHHHHHEVVVIKKGHHHRY